MNLVFSIRTFDHIWERSMTEVKYPNPEADLDRIYERLGNLERFVRENRILDFQDLASTASVTGKLVAQSYGYDVDFDEWHEVYDPDEDDPEDDATGFPDNFFGTLGLTRLNLSNADCPCKCEPGVYAGAPQPRSFGDLHYEAVSGRPCPYTEDDWEEAYWVNRLLTRVNEIFRA